MSLYPRKYNLLIVDDHQLIIDGLTGILKEEKMIGEIHSATNGDEAIALVASTPIDCILMDVAMPKVSGYEATRIIKKRIP